VPPTATAAPTKAAAGSGDAKDVITKALRAQMTKSLRAVVTTQSPTEKSDIKIEFVPTDNYHLTINSAEGIVEMIITGGKSYMKVGDTWQLFPVDIAGLIQEMTADTTDSAIGSISDVKLVGPDVLDGAPMMVYTFKQTVTITGQTQTSDVKAWIGVSDGLTHKSISESTVAGVTTTTTQIITYDPSIKITPPM
jgi:hypothetical protein